MTANGKVGITFKPEDSNGQTLELPCGQCIGCRLERSRQWAIRCVHEASFHDHNSFITLTYNDDHLPPDGSLSVEHWQKFMKRLRFHHRPKKFRYFHCGEYGSKLGRPHYHACLFGLDFDDKQIFRQSEGATLYTSSKLDEIWGKGYTTVGDVTFESAAYVARYIMKKVTGEAAEDHYEKVDPITGEIHRIKPEYTTMSRRPGLGQGWIEKYMSDVYPSDEVVLLRNGKSFRMKPPKYYNGRFEIRDAEAMEAIRTKRKKLARQKEDNSPERLAQRHIVKLAQVDQLKRPLT